MDRIIGYKEAKALMLDGYRVKEVPQFRGPRIPYMLGADGTVRDRIRADSWEKLRRECHIMERLPGTSKLHNIYIWGYGDKVVGPGSGEV